MDLENIMVNEINSDRRSPEALISPLHGIWNPKQQMNKQDKRKLQAQKTARGLPEGK